MNEWVLADNARTETVFRWALDNQRPDRLLMVMRLRGELDSLAPEEPRAVSAALRLTRGNVIDVQVASGWPVTTLTDAWALILVVAFSPAMAQRLADECEAFFDWRHDRDSPLPEDLCLFKEGAARPVLVSTTHDRDGRLFVVSDRIVPGAELETCPVDISPWLFDQRNCFLRDGRRVTSALDELTSRIVVDKNAP